MFQRNLVGLITIAVLSVSACSSVRPGLKNHPADCAIGIPWADCLPGTTGYANGDGRIHREEAENQQSEATSRIARTNAQCITLYQVPELDPIREKVELHQANADAAVPFEIAANDTFPTDSERSAIGMWATLREQSLKLMELSKPKPSDMTLLQQTLAEKDAASGRTPLLGLAI